MPRQSLGSLPDTGPVALDNGDAESVYAELAHTFEALAALHAKLVSLEPPMWVLDGCEEVAEFVTFAERNVAGAGGCAWSRLDNPGAYAPQDRFGIPKAGFAGRQAGLEGLNSLVKRLAGSRAGILESETGWEETVPVKRYLPEPGNELPEIARIDGDRILALERVHVDRVRDQGKAGYGEPMRLTLIMSYDDAGGTYFPYAQLLQPWEGVESLPCVVDKRSTRMGDQDSWPVREGGDRGVLVRGKRGRLLVFGSSSSADEKVPLYSSLHQGVLVQRDGVNAGGPPRVVSVIGVASGGGYETSAFHECLDHETIETRAEFFGRTVDQEATGILMTVGSYRRQEAYAFLQDRAQLRRTTVEAIVAEELERDPSLNRLEGSRFASRLHRSATAPASAPAVPRQIFWRDKCSVCLDDMKVPGVASPPGAVVPGYLACGHTLCKLCADAISSHIRRGGRAICPECRMLSSQPWQPLFVDGDWVAEATRGSTSTDSAPRERAVQEHTSARPTAPRSGLVRAPTNDEAAAADETGTTDAPSQSSSSLRWRRCWQRSDGVLIAEEDLQRFRDRHGQLFRWHEETGRWFCEDGRDMGVWRDY